MRNINRTFKLVVAFAKCQRAAIQKIGYPGCLRDFSRSVMELARAV